ncbi:hypothetical protein XENORESO_018864 [Xenotaenia resolanae]|uniref:Uncharacterized protein n=1 Tax=Xenotaenia resolanae TaxID=208358 RepID=A0ABV0WRT3_9TELE
MGPNSNLSKSLKGKVKYLIIIIKWMSKSYSSNLIVSAVSRFNPQTIDELLLVFVTRFSLFFFTLAVGCFIRGYAARLQEVFPSAEQKQVYGNATNNVQSRAELFQAGQIEPVEKGHLSVAIEASCM